MAKKLKSKNCGKITRNFLNFQNSLSKAFEVDANILTVNDGPTDGQSEI